jgi:haloalkane dehalogenase
MHDWGGLIGLRWACEHPDAVRGLVISSTGFFPDGRWHGMAKALREPRTGEQMIGAIDRDTFASVMRQSMEGVGDEALDEYWKAYSDATRRMSQLDLYRSGDFSKLEEYDLTDLGVPALLVWGEHDEFAPVAGAHRFERELPDTELVVVDGTGHFVWDEAPEQCAEALTRFLARLP